MIFWCHQCDLQEKLPGRFWSIFFNAGSMDEGELSNRTCFKQSSASRDPQPFRRRRRKKRGQNDQPLQRISVSGIPFEVVTPKFAEVSIWEWKSLWEFMIRRWRLLEIFSLGGLHCTDCAKQGPGQIWVHSAWEAWIARRKCCRISLVSTWGRPGAPVGFRPFFVNRWLFAALFVVPFEVWLLTVETLEWIWKLPPKTEGHDISSVHLFAIYNSVSFGKHQTSLDQRICMGCYSEEMRRLALLLETQMWKFMEIPLLAKELVPQFFTHWCSILSFKYWREIQL